MTGRKVIDLCAGIGSLAFAYYHRGHRESVCLLMEDWPQGCRNLPRWLQGCSADERQERGEQGGIRSSRCDRNPGSNVPPCAARRRLPDERASLTHKFNFAGHEGYITVGLYPNGQPGEIFIRMAKEGSTISGLMDSFAMVFSTAWRSAEGNLRQACEYPLRAVRLDRQRSPGICQVGHGLHRPLAPAPLSRRRAARHLHVDCSSERCCGSGDGQRIIPATEAERTITDLLNVGDAPVCSVCGLQTTPSGSCFKCPTCGGTTGCS